ncbi:MAG: ATP-binding protein, partial [Rickettsiaceae bacterium]|nr:ATP-binding protein [Rickettsiaceae bacterium]
MLDIDSFIVISFLVVTFIIGIRYAKGITTIKDYALGGRNFSTGALVATLVATWVGAGSFSITLSKVYSDGLYYLIASMGMGISLFLTAFVFVPRMGEFLGNTSIAESMGNLYGKNIRIITAVTGIAASIGSIAVQFKVFGSLFSYFLEFSNTYGIILAATIVIIYSATGGIKAVTFTDVVQFFTFGTAIPIVGVMIWNQFYYTDFSFANGLIDPKFNLNRIFDVDNPKLLSMITLILYCALPGLKPNICQRILIGNNIAQVKKAFIITGFLVMLIQLALAWIPFVIFNVDSSLDSNHLLSYVMNNYTYIGLKGILISGVIAMAMSTADSYINSSAVLFANDICNPLNLGKNQTLLISKIFAFLLGGAGIALALVEKDLLGIVLTANSFYIPVVTAPLVLSILGFRSSTKSVLIGMAAGFVTISAWKLFKIEADGLVFSMFINLIFVISSHYLLRQPGGWIDTKNKKVSEDLQQEKPLKKGYLISKLYNFNFSQYCKTHFPNSEFSYIGLGLYLILFTLTTMYSTQTELLKENSRIILALYQLMLVSGMIFLMRPIWPKIFDSNQKTICVQILWPIVIFYTLILLNTFFVIVSDFSILQFGIFTMNLLITVLLLGWQLAIVFIVAGILMGIKFHQYYNPEYVFAMYIGSPAFVTIYVLMFIGAIVALFFKPKQEQFEATETRAVNLESKVTSLEKENDFIRREVQHLAEGIEYSDNQLKTRESQYKEKSIYLRDKIKLMNIEIEKLQDMKDEFLRNMPHESNAPLTGILSLSDALYSSYDSLDKTAIKDSIKSIVNSGDRLKSYIYNMVDLSKLSSFSYELERKEINLSELVKTRPYLYKKIFSDDKKQEFKFDVEDDIMVNADEYFMTQAIDNLISNAVEYGEGKEITINLKKANDKVEFKIADQGIGIPANELNSIFSKFITSSRTKTRAGGRGIGLALV